MSQLNTISDAKAFTHCHNIALDHLKCIKSNAVTIITMVIFNNPEIIAPYKIQNDDSQLQQLHQLSIAIHSL